MRIYIYHDGKQPKIVNKEDAQAWFDKGWVDSPAKIKGILGKFKVAPGDEIGVQVVGEEIEGWKERLNGLLNIGLMSAKQLRKFVKKHFDLEFKKGTRKSTILSDPKCQQHVTL